MPDNHSIQFEWRPPFGFDKFSDISGPDGTHFG